MKKPKELDMHENTLRAKFKKKKERKKKKENKIYELIKAELQTNK